MQRYTAIYHPLSPEADSADLRSLLAAALAQAFPTGSYRLGSVTQPIDGQVSAEVAANATKNNLRPILQSAGEQAGFALEQLGWGWLVSGRSTTELIDENTGDLLHDPLADQPIQAEPDAVYYYGWLQTLALVFNLIMGVFVLVVIGGYTLNPAFAVWISANAITLLIGALLFWMVARLVGSLVTPWNYIRWLRIDSNGLEIKRLLGAPMFLPWDQIVELRWNSGRIHLMAADRLVQFPLLEKHGIPDYLALVRTIIVRSQLEFVGGKVGTLVYLKFDA